MLDKQRLKELIDLITNTLPHLLVSGTMLAFSRSKA
jgi:hypothetical protein